MSVLVFSLLLLIMPVSYPSLAITSLNTILYQSQIWLSSSSFVFKKRIEGLSSTALHGRDYKEVKTKKKANKQKKAVKKGKGRTQGMKKVNKRNNKKQEKCKKLGKKQKNCKDKLHKGKQSRVKKIKKKGRLNNKDKGNDGFEITKEVNKECKKQGKCKKSKKCKKNRTEFENQCGMKRIVGGGVVKEGLLTYQVAIVNLVGVSFKK